LKISHIFVSLQVIFVLILAFTGPVIPDDKVLLAIEILFAVFALWAMKDFKFRFSIMPEPKRDGELKTSGPYRIVRHPMYSSLIFITLIWLINSFSVFRLIIWICLILVLNYKAAYEEKLLSEKHPEYVSLITKTKKFIPFIY